MKKYLKFTALCFLMLPFSLNAWIASDIQELIKGNDRLLKRSSRDFITVEEGKYVVFSHGYASLESGFEESRMAAKVDSFRQISKLVGATEVSGNSSFEYASKGDTAIEKIFTSDQIDSSMFIRNAQTRGYWVDDDCFHIISCIYLNINPSVEKSDLTEEFYDIELAKDDIDILEANRDIWLGGAKIIYNTKDKDNYLIVIVSAEENLPEYILERTLRPSAIKEAINYLNTVSFKNKSITTKEMQSISIGGAEDVETSESFKNINIAKVKGSITSLEKVGTLKHKISKRKYALFIKNLKDL